MKGEEHENGSLHSGQLVSSAEDMAHYLTAHAVSGVAKPGFEAARAASVENFTRRSDLGAAGSMNAATPETLSDDL